MTRLLFIRHGQSEDNAARILAGWRDHPLTDLGREQARAAAERLRPFAPFAALYTSPLKRAAETAAIIGAEFGLIPITRAYLQEMYFGRLEGLTEAEAEAQFPPEKHDGPGGDTVRIRLEMEPRLNFSQRVDRVMEEIEQAHAGQTVLVVAHYAVLNFIAGRAQGHALPQYDHLGGWSNGSLAEVVMNGGSYRLVSIESASRLDADFKDEHG